MNRWLLIRRLPAPAFLILFGILALLNQWGVFGFRRSWPLFLILAGLLLLAERASLAGEPSPDAIPAGTFYPPAYGSGGPAAGMNAPVPTGAASSDASSSDASSSGEAGNASRGGWRP